MLSLPCLLLPFFLPLLSFLDRLPMAFLCLLCAAIRTLCPLIMCKRSWRRARQDLSLKHCSFHGELHGIRMPVLITWMSECLISVCTFLLGEYIFCQLHREFEFARYLSTCLLHMSSALFSFLSIHRLFSFRVHSFSFSISSVFGFFLLLSFHSVACQSAFRPIAFHLCLFPGCSALSLLFLSVFSLAVSAVADFLIASFVCSLDSPGLDCIDLWLAAFPLTVTESIFDSCWSVLPEGVA